MYHSYRALLTSAYSEIRDVVEVLTLLPKALASKIDNKDSSITHLKSSPRVLVFIPGFNWAVLITSTFFFKDKQFLLFFGTARAVLPVEKEAAVFAQSSWHARGLSARVLRIAYTHVHMPASYARPSTSIKMTSQVVDRRL